MELNQFQQAILNGIPDTLPDLKEFDSAINHAPKRKPILSEPEKRLFQAAASFWQSFHP